MGWIKRLKKYKTSVNCIACAWCMCDVIDIAKTFEIVKRVRC